MNTPSGHPPRRASPQHTSRKAVTVVSLMLAVVFAATAPACGRSEPRVDQVGPGHEATPSPQLVAIFADYARSLLPYYGLVEVNAPTRLTRDEALRLGREFATAPNRPSPGRVDQVQALLVRYTADPSYFEYGKLSWFLVFPTTMELGLHSGPARVPTPGPNTPQVLMYWPCEFAIPLDDDTGLFWGGSWCTFRRPGPSATPNQKRQLDSYAATYGWWPVWSQLHQYDGKPIPESAIQALQRP